MFNEKWCKQCKQIKFKCTIKKSLYKNKHTEQHRTHRTTRLNKHSELTFCVFRIFSFVFVYLRFLQWFLQQVLSFRLGTDKDFHWGFKPVLSYSIPYTKEKEKKHLLSLSNNWQMEKQQQKITSFWNRDVIVACSNMYYDLLYIFGNDTKASLCVKVRSQNKTVRSVKATLKKCALPKGVGCDHDSGVVTNENRKHICLLLCTNNIY